MGLDLWVCHFLVTSFLFLEKITKKKLVCPGLEQSLAFGTQSCMPQCWLAKRRCGFVGFLFLGAVVHRSYWYYISSILSIIWNMTLNSSTGWLQWCLLGFLCGWKFNTSMSSTCYLEKNKQCLMCDRKYFSI